MTTTNQTSLTKLYKLLLIRSISQKELIDLIEKKTGKKIEKYRISKIINGKITNYHTNTCRMIAQTLGVHMEDILED